MSSAGNAWAWLMSHRVVPKYASAVYAEWRISEDEKPTPKADQLEVERMLKDLK